MTPNRRNEFVRNYALILPLAIIALFAMLAWCLIRSVDTTDAGWSTQYSVAHGPLLPPDPWQDGIRS